VTAPRCHLVLPLPGAPEAAAATLAPVHGKPMIGHALDRLGGPGIQPLVIAPRGALGDVRAQYLALQHDAELIEIAPHGDGPAASLAHAAPALLQRDLGFYETPLILAPAWGDWHLPAGGLAALLDTDMARALVCWQGFHPQLHGRTDLPRLSLDDKARAAALVPDAVPWAGEARDICAVGPWLSRRGGEIVETARLLVTEPSRRTEVGWDLSALITRMLEVAGPARMLPASWMIDWADGESLADFERWQILLSQLDEIPADSAFDRVMPIAPGYLDAVADGAAPVLGGRLPHALIEDQYPPGHTTLLVPAGRAGLLPPRGEQDLLATEPLGAPDRPARAALLHGAMAEPARLRGVLIIEGVEFCVFDGAAFTEFLAWQKPEIALFTYRPGPLEQRLGLAPPRLELRGEHVEGIAPPAARDDRPALAGTFWLGDGGLLARFDRLAPNADIPAWLDDLRAAGHRLRAFPLDARLALDPPPLDRELAFWLERRV